MLRSMIMLVIFTGLNACAKSDSKGDDASGDSQKTNGTLSISATDGDAVSLSAKNMEQMSLAQVGISTDFSGAGALQVEAAKLLQTGKCTGNESSDQPHFEDGLDCDKDGGVVAHQTPTKYRIAFKNISLNMAEGEPIEVISFPTLSAIDESGIFEFAETSSGFQLPINPLKIKSKILSIDTEIYFYEMTLNIYGEEKTIRIYLSDDDFEHEEDSSHHQGDITFFDDGTEHWANGGKNWFSDLTATLTRGDFANGAAGTDSETGHSRGMFGNEEFWNQEEFKQGSRQDIFKKRVETGGEGLGYTLGFDVSDTWFYEDFDTTNKNSFDPCINNSLEACGGEWAPIFPKVSVSAKDINDSAEDISIVVKDQHIISKVGEAQNIVVEIKGLDESYVLPTPENLPDGMKYDVEKPVTISWTPEQADVRDEPYLIPIVVQRKDLSGVVRTLAIKVEE